MDKSIYTVEEIKEILGIGKNQAYQLVKSGQFPIVKVGSKYIISKKGFDLWLNNGVNETI